MPLPSSGPISMAQVNMELGRSSTQAVSLNESAVRTLLGRGSGQITLSDAYGSARLVIASNQTNLDLRTFALNAGWNGAGMLLVEINSGVFVGSNSTGVPALTISGSFPKGVRLINNGFIVGMGGAGGQGGSLIDGGGFVTGISGQPGANGGIALSASTAVSIINNSVIAGGGGGGGGGARDVDGSGKVSASAYGGGGGGGRSSQFNSAGGLRGADYIQGANTPGTAGNAGTSSSPGAGGAGGSTQGISRWLSAGAGGNGGDWGSGGASGQASPWAPDFGAGGSAGAAVSGNGNITWLATGSRYGAIT